MSAPSFADLRKEAAALLEGGVEGARELPPLVHALGLLHLGDLHVFGWSRDPRRAFEFHKQAITVAQPLMSSPDPSVRREAQRIVIDAHLAAAHDIASGTWSQKADAVPQWIDRARDLLDATDDPKDDPLDDPLEMRLRLVQGALRALADLQPASDPAPWLTEVNRVAKRHRPGEDPLFRQRIDGMLGTIYFRALELAHARGDFESGKAYAKMALDFIRPSKRRGTPKPAQLAQLYFRIGANYAVHADDHVTAVQWYDRAAEALLALQEEPPNPRKLGEALVSMGVSYWMTGHHNRALEFTETGTDVIERAVDRGLLDTSAMAVPFGNLAAMHRELGNESQYQEFAKLAAKHRELKRQ